MAIESDSGEENGDDVDGSLEFESELSAASAIDRVRMIIDEFGADSVTLLTSFGVQSGVMLSLVAEACPDVRVMFIDTQGPTSERDLAYGREVMDVLGLKNFTVAKAGVTKEEFRQGMEDVGICPEREKTKHVFHSLSQDVFKVTPLKRECAASDVQCLLSGVRRGQTSDRDHFKFLQHSQSDPDKGHPILDLSDEDCLEILRLKNIPPHPELNSLLDEIATAAVVEKGSNPKNLNKMTSSLRGKRISRKSGAECGIHVQSDSDAPGKDPVPPLPNVVVGKTNCRFCIATKSLLADVGINFVEVPLHLFPHLIPTGTKTVPVVYINKLLVGGYGDVCEFLEIEDTLNTK